jgi:hypothetical protein
VIDATMDEDRPEQTETDLQDGERLEVVLADLDGLVRVKLRGDLDYGTTVAHHSVA